MRYLSVAKVKHLHTLLIKQSGGALGIGHAATEVFLMMNGYEIASTVDDQENIILSIASGELKREAFQRWLESNIKPIQKDRAG